MPPSREGIFPAQGLNPPALAGGFFTTEPPGKPQESYCCLKHREPQISALQIEEGLTKKLQQTKYRYVI